MSRREAVRIVLFERATLVGSDRSLTCAITDLSGKGARLSVSGKLPAPPLRIQFELDGHEFEFFVELQRVSQEGHVGVAFNPPHSERLYRLIATEQRRAIAQGRQNVSERRAPRPVRGVRGGVVQESDATAAPDEGAPHPR